MKYVVVCYAVHERGIVSYDSFDELDKAIYFMKEDAEGTYMEEKEDEENAELTFYDCEAELHSYNGEYIWTWEIISID